MEVNKDRKQSPSAFFTPGRRTVSASEACIAVTVENAVSEFRKSGSGFPFSTGWDRDRIFWFSVPFERGWKAYVDGTETEICNSGGMIALDVPTGNHQTVFTYHTPGYREGAVLSAISVLLFLFISVLEIRRKASSGVSG